MEDPRDFISEAVEVLKTPEALPVLLKRDRGRVTSWLAQALHEGETYQRKYAAFVLGQIGAIDALDGLQNAYDAEQVRGVKEAMGAALVALRTYRDNPALTEVERRRIVQDVYDGKSPGHSPASATIPRLPESTEPKKSGGCWIATVAYGPNSPEVMFLQRFRDRELNTRLLGRVFIRLYYETSPALARVMRGSSFANRCVRRILLVPSLRLLGFGEHERHAGANNTGGFKPST